jgi:succinate-semialdehyde dehydrogenase/glutarate-semialdehyde dehydrogenase
MSTYAVVDPATGKTVKEYPTATDAQVGEAMTAAAKAFKEWSKKSTVAERAAMVAKVGALHTERREKLAEIITREMGKPTDQALGEIDFCAAIYEFYATNAEKFLADEPIELLGGDGTAVIRRQAVGTILGIMYVSD